VSVAAPVTTLAAGAITGLATVATSGAYADLSGKPTLFSGSYSDLSSVPASFAPSAHNQAWSTITSTPTTLSGYGITDAVGSSDSRLTNSRTPTSHAASHGAGGADAVSPASIGAAATGHAHAASDITSGTLEIGRIPAGTTSTTVCIGNDARLSDARAPLTHSHAASDITSGTIATARLAGSGTASASTYLRGDQTWATVAASYTLPASTTSTLGGVIVGTGIGVTSGTVSVTFGTTAGTSCQGNDSRLSDARTPTSHAHGNITNAGAIGSTSGLPIITTTSGVLTAGEFGTTAGTFCQGNDSRLSARTSGYGNTLLFG
jgi:hypothetical protein